MNALDRILDLWTRSEPTREAQDAAQLALQRTLASGDSRLKRRRLRRAGGWAAVAASVLTVVSVPLMLTSTSAFTRAQQYLNDFQTLGFELEFMSGDVLLMRGHVVMTPDGNYRHTWGDIQSVRNKAVGRSVVLFSVPRMYLEPDINQKNETDRWIELISGLRQFDGQAIKLPEERSIGGQPATGWNVTVRGKPATLWTSEEGYPLELDVQETAKARVHYRFEYNAPVTGDTFDTSIPAGYRSAAPEEAECQKTGKPIWKAVNEAEYTDPTTGEKKTRKYMIRYDCKRPAVTG
jgi:hypothetical protein